MANGQDRTGFGAFLSGVGIQQKNQQQALREQIERSRQRAQQIKTQVGLTGAGLELAPTAQPTFGQRLTGQQPAPQVRQSAAGLAAQQAASQLQTVKQQRAERELGIKESKEKREQREFNVLNVTVPGDRILPELKGIDVPIKFAGPLLTSLAKARITGAKVNIPKATQFEAATFGERTLDAHTVLEQLITDPDFDPAGFGTTFQRSRLVPERFKSENVKLLDQSQRNFINATLRRESGAAIAESEFKNANVQYFPQPGDTPAALLQKKQNRERIIFGLLREAKGVEGLVNFTPTTFNIADESGDAIQIVFKDAAAAKRASLPKGTRIFVGGRPAKVK